MTIFKSKIADRIFDVKDVVLPCLLASQSTFNGAKN